MSNPDYQSIGALSPEGEIAATTQAAWAGLAGQPPPPRHLAAALQSPTFSRWNQRANTQRLAATSDRSYAADLFHVDPDPDDHPMAGYGPEDGSYAEPPMAAITPAPFTLASDGVIDGATAARERSGNQGLLSP